MGYACVHSVIDDYSRVVYSEIHDDEKADTAVGVLQRAVSWFSARGVKVERVLSDNGSAYRSQAWQAACQQLGIKAKHTRPYRPQTNGKALSLIVGFQRGLLQGGTIHKSPHGTKYKYRQLTFTRIFFPHRTY